MEMERAAQETLELSKTGTLAFRKAWEGLAAARFLVLRQQLNLSWGVVRKQKGRLGTCRPGDRWLGSSRLI